MFGLPSKSGEATLLVSSALQKTFANHHRERHDRHTGEEAT